MADDYRNSDDAFDMPLSGQREREDRVSEQQLALISPIMPSEALNQVRSMPPKTSIESDLIKMIDEDNSFSEGDDHCFSGHMLKVQVPAFEAFATDARGTGWNQDCSEHHQSSMHLALQKVRAVSEAGNVCILESQQSLVDGQPI